MMILKNLNLGKLFHMRLRPALFSLQYLDVHQNSYWYYTAMWIWERKCRDCGDIRKTQILRKTPLAEVVTGLKTS